VNIDASVVYRIARALVHYLAAKDVVIGFDARSTSEIYSKSAINGVIDQGANVLEIGLCGTEEMYSAVVDYHADAGVMVTASHNPINYNGLKFVKSHSRPLDPKIDLPSLKDIAENAGWGVIKTKGEIIDISAVSRDAYIKRILKLVNVKYLNEKKVLFNCGNGSAGPTLKLICDQLVKKGAQLEFVLVNQEPDSQFPNGIPNPMLPENQHITSELVRHHGADIGIAFDGDFDRCFFFDEYGDFVSSEYIIGILAQNFLEKFPGYSILHDPRVVWNIKDTIKNNKGNAVQIKTGHVNMKQAMCEFDALYGGELSAHHFFKDFSYCDSGMIPWLLVVEVLGKKNLSLFDLVAARKKKFLSSGEVSIKASDHRKVLEKTLEKYASRATYIEDVDGLSISMRGWRFNLRISNTETLLRLNIETKTGVVDPNLKCKEFISFIKGYELT